MFLLFAVAIHVLLLSIFSTFSVYSPINHQSRDDAFHSIPVLLLKPFNPAPPPQPLSDLPQIPQLTLPEVKQSPILSNTSQRIASFEDNIRRELASQSANNLPKTIDILNALQSPINSSTTEITGTLFGSTVPSSSKDTIVVLDISGSMAPLSDKARSLAQSHLPGCTIVTANAALFATDDSIDRLKREAKTSDYILAYYKANLDGSIIKLVHKMFDADGLRPQAIYFYSDYEDYVDAKAVDEFSDYLVEKRTKFFAVSVEKKPDSSIERLCIATGGQLLIAK
jgi:hypothetical protein